MSDESVSRELEVARAELEMARRMLVVDQELVQAGAIDIETARLVVQEALKGREGVIDGEAIRALVGEVKGKKGFLFRGEGGGKGAKGQDASPAIGAARAARARESGFAAMEDLAARAKATGDRKALLSYLRLRRRGGV